MLILYFENEAFWRHHKLVGSDRVRSEIWWVRSSHRKWTCGCLWL